MKLSVLIPMYNAKDYIGNCIECLLNQNLAQDDYEIIIMDDGSTDNSVEIVEAYIKSHNNIKLNKASNSGAYTTRNKLLKLAKGDYVYNIDADDYLAHHSLANVMTIAEAEALDIIGFKTVETSELDKHALAEPISRDKVEISSGNEFIENHPYLRLEIWWYFIKREFLLKHNLTFSNNEYNADVVFTLQALLNAKKIGFLPITIHRYVQTENSLMRSQNFEILEKRIAYMQMMIGNTSQLINGLKDGNGSEILINNIEHRRDVFTFFNIMDMVKNKFPLEYVKDKMNGLKSTNAYPIKHFSQHRYKKFRYKIMVSLLNNETCLYSLASLKHTFSKKLYN